jgi:hypothetical protein
MSWEAVSAIASIASAFIVLIAAIAAVRQLRHMRLANQLSSYFQVMAWIQSAEGIEAGRFLRSLDLSDRATLLTATTPKVDHRLSSIGAHYQNVARLLNLGVLDDSLFGSYYDMVPRVWKQLQPIAAVMREQTRAAIWIDFEYLVYRESKQRILGKLFRRYPVDFVNPQASGDAIAAAGGGSNRTWGITIGKSRDFGGSSQGSIVEISLPMVITTAPQSSVRSTRALERSSVSVVDGAGWPRPCNSDRRDCRTFGPNQTADRPASPQLLAGTHRRDRSRDLTHMTYPTDEAQLEGTRLSER